MTNATSDTSLSCPITTADQLFNTPVWLVTVHFNVSSLASSGIHGISRP